MKYLQNNERVQRDRARQVGGVSPVDGVQKHAIDTGQEQHGHEHDMPDKRAAQQGFVTRSRWTAHHGQIGRLKGECQPQRRGSDQVDPEDLHRRHRQRKAKDQGHHYRRRLTGIRRQCPTDHLLDIVINCPPLLHTCYN